MRTMWYTPLPLFFGFDLLEKEKPFGVIAETLGVVLDTIDARMETIKVSNQPDRSEALAWTLGCIIKQRKAVVRRRSAGCSLLRPRPRSSVAPAGSRCWISEPGHQVQAFES